MNKYQKALDTILEKTDSLNNTCVRLPKCLKEGIAMCSLGMGTKCHCEDYRNASLLQDLVTKEEALKPVSQPSGKSKRYKYTCPNCGEFLFNANSQTMRMMHNLGSNNYN